jgi:hypothetical protein
MQYHISRPKESTSKSSLTRNSLQSVVFILCNAAERALALLTLFGFCLLSILDHTLKTDPIACRVYVYFFGFRFLLKSIVVGRVIIISRGRSMKGWISGITLVLVIWTVSVL